MSAANPARVPFCNGMTKFVDVANSRTPILEYSSAQELSTRVASASFKLLKFEVLLDTSMTNRMSRTVAFLQIVPTVKYGQSAVGANVGSNVGPVVGGLVGDGVGSVLGDGVGSIVGDGTGASVGDGLGMLVGDGVGTPVGAGVGMRVCIGVLSQLIGTSLKN